MGILKKAGLKILRPLENLVRPKYHLTKPSRIAIELTNRCNLNCPFCLVGMQNQQESVAHNDLTRDWGKMSLELGEKAMREGKAFGMKEVMLHFQGEPLMHKEFVEFVNLGRKNSLRSVVFTNGLLLDEGRSREIIKAGLGSIRFSVDGATQEIYKLNRVGGQFDQVHQNMADFVRIAKEEKSEINIMWQFIAMKNNEHEIPLARKMAEKIDIPFFVKTFAESLPDEATTFEEYRRVLLAKPCRDIYRVMFVYWNGEVVPCCYDQDGKEIMGNLNNQTVTEIWEGESYSSFRQHLIEVLEHPENEPELCKSCLKWTHPNRIKQGDEYLEDDPEEDSGDFL